MPAPRRTPASRAPAPGAIPSSVRPWTSATRRAPATRPPVSAPIRPSPMTRVAMTGTSAPIQTPARRAFAPPERPWCARPRTTATTPVSARRPRDAATRRNPTARIVTTVTCATASTRARREPAPRPGPPWSAWPRISVTMWERAIRLRVLAATPPRRTANPARTATSAPIRTPASPVPATPDRRWCASRRTTVTWRGSAMTRPGCAATRPRPTGPAATTATNAPPAINALRAPAPGWILRRRIATTPTCAPTTPATRLRVAPMSPTRPWSAMLRTATACPGTGPSSVRGTDPVPPRHSPRNATTRTPAPRTPATTLRVASTRR